MNAYLQLLLWGAAPAIVAYGCNRFIIKGSYSRSKLIKIGLIFGIGGVLANTFGVYVADVDATVCARDAFSIVSAFWFGPLAGLITTIVVAVERALTPLWGVGAASWIRSAGASGVVGIFAIVIAKYLFHERRPALIPAIFLAAIAEVIHLAVVYLFGYANMGNSFGIVASALVPMTVVSALAAAFSAIACKSVGTFKANFVSYVSGIAIFYFLAICGTWEACYRNARHKTETLLDYSQKDLEGTIDAIVYTMLAHSAQALTGHIGYAYEMDVHEAQKLAKMYDFDELNIVRKDGVIIASSDITAVGMSMDEFSESRQFMCLTNGVTRTFDQPFRVSVSNPDVVCKYVGVAFPKGDGYIQLGYLDKRLNKSFITDFGRILDTWIIGEDGYFLCSDPVSGVLVADVAQHQGLKGKALAEIGIDLTDFQGRNKNDTIVCSIMGERCFVRKVEFAKHYLFAVVPATEFYGPLLQFTFVVASIMLIVFIVFGYMLGRMIESGKRIAIFHAKENERRERDLNMAKMIQSSALPAIFPPFAHEKRIDIFAMMTPAKEVGGDFYDFYMLDGEHLVFMVADVSGKGIPAAMFMMKAKTIIESMIRTTPTLSEAIVAANQRLSEGNDAAMFVTCWVGIIDLSSGEIDFVNAGHNPPFIRKADGSLNRITERSGLALATISDAKYVTHKTQLDKDELILLYTDGVTEAMNNNGEQFFESRLATTLSGVDSCDSTYICKLVKRAVDEFAAGAAQSDDITILALNRKGI